MRSSINELVAQGLLFSENDADKCCVGAGGGFGGLGIGTASRMY